MPQDDPMVKEFDRIMDEYAGSASMMVVARRRAGKTGGVCRRRGTDN